VHENTGLVEQISKRFNGGKFEFAKIEDEQHKLWSARKEALWSMLALRKGNEEV